MAAKRKSDGGAKDGPSKPSAPRKSTSKAKKADPPAAEKPKAKAVNHSAPATAKAPAKAEKHTVAKRVSPEERQEMIKRAAYYRAEKRGFQGASPEEDWAAAEAEVDAKISKMAKSA